ncbi:reverse transcriptase [Caerostris extrusa]|uniref:Reverse transcriptase n=1 Tax=Caerostris extrusa TaxID=172846 RepID=A0AAV4MQM7_CAEEX|nr:reverse transcriptase [Caerostris extrusa]
MERFLKDPNICKQKSANGTSVNLLVSKTKVSPRKQISILRLELLDVTLLISLLKAVLGGLDMGIQDSEIHSSTDSKVVLLWLSSHPKCFITNKTSKILESLPSNSWHYVPSEENPTDMATRGIKTWKVADFGGIGQIFIKILTTGSNTSRSCI